MINTFDAKIAKDFNLNSAIFVQQLAQWTFLNLANCQNIYDGLCWSFNTLEAYEVIFPWWTKRQLETVIANVVADGLVIKGNYNKHKYDRTVWYALTHKALSYFPEITSERNLRLMANTISPNWEMYDSEVSQHENVDRHFTFLRSAFPQNVITIPTYNTTKKDLKNEKN